MVYDTSYVDGDFRFMRDERLKKRVDISAVFKKGKCVSCQGAKFFILQNRLERNRIAFTFARKFGNAVERNRSRRISREAYRRLKSETRQGFDLVLLVYPVSDISVGERMKQLTSLFKKGNIQKIGSFESIYR
ncbi:MAG: ribonuclease P protein component [Treponema sp.]|jgi:ribonuclease P protein component|nr:ribonuclease P protein component [Treponema sp.]